MNDTIFTRDRMLGGLWGALVGDALGVPVEFLSRSDVRLNPVTGMRGQGTHRQPTGTWSDDGSLTLCTVDSLNRHEFDTKDMGWRFLSWYREELWTPHGKLFDVGVTTADALQRIACGISAELAGGDGQFTNGNGSLMRILPVALRFHREPAKTFVDRIHRVSGITHRHPRSQMACGLFALVVGQLLEGAQPDAAVARGLDAFRVQYESHPWWGAEWDYFQLLLTGNLADLPEQEIKSGGYVIETLAASLWCLLTTRSFPDCVLKAVNLGGDTDTTGCVAGGLAGVCYGVPAVPQEWRRALARAEDLNGLFNHFVERAVPPA